VRLGGGWSLFRVRIRIPVNAAKGRVTDGGKVIHPQSQEL
jgi:hypothetical protein